MIVRSIVQCEVLAPGVTTRSGVLDNGNKWSIDEVTVIDSDRNKATLRVQHGVNVPVGFCHLDVDCATKGNARIEVKAARPIAKP
jgi:hypothetical protein